MIDRIAQEKREYEILSEYACKSAESMGREIKENKCQIRTEFQRDRDRIIHSKAFRRLKHKTQVFLSGEDEDHFRTRLTHTLEVSQISRTIVRALGLNEDLAEAIALGHDLGHTPFGHRGEKILNEIHPGGFEHNKQSLRVVSILELNSRQRGMNLTKEVRDGILNHTGPERPFTLEGQVVKTSDRIAYINHDIDDALRSGVIAKKDLPINEIKILGSTHSERINKMVVDMIENSFAKRQISMSDEVNTAMIGLRNFMFDKVYLSSNSGTGKDTDKVEEIITTLYDYYINNHEMLPSDIKEVIAEYGLSEVVKDYIAGMTDGYAIKKYFEIK
ncbi:MAG: deoxyguanosinetriphosphate triphosphohydrolase [Anaerovoracaceae bacterium]